MFITFIIAFFSLMILITLHEFGHFILAKKFGVKLEEFGFGYPPRIFAKKIGETIYSLNLLPFGAFVRLPEEIGETKKEGTFSQLPVLKRIFIVLGGVISFWIMAIILFTIVFSLGTRIAISDEENQNLINPAVQIAFVAPNSPAEKAGIKIGDIIKEFKFQDLIFKIEKVKETQTLIETHKGKEVVFTIQRGKEVFDVKLIPRVLPPENEGAVGIILIRTSQKSYPFYSAFWQGILATFNLTKTIIEGYGMALINVFKRLPSGIQMMGPVGIFSLLTQMTQLGISYFLQFIGMIAIYFAIFNLLPIPTFDGGKLLFLIIEGVRKKPINPKVEQRITTICFGLLIFLMFWVTIKDISHLF